MPRARGSLPKTPPPPAPDVAAARQSHPPSSGVGPSLPPQERAVDNGGAPQPQDPGTGSGSSAGQRRTQTPAAAMMDYELLHNEARLRPWPRPRRRPERASRGPGPSGRRFRGRSSASLLWSLFPLEPGPVRPFKRGFSEGKVSSKEAPASSVLPLVFDNSGQVSLLRPIGR